MNEAKPPARPTKLPPTPLNGEGPATRESLRPEDFYMDGHYLVFTAQYHLRRGFCCNSDCRHCPYK